MKLKNYVVVALFAFAAFMVVSCKSDSANGGEGKTYDTIEIMYERVLPVLCPYGCIGDKDPDGFNVYNYDHGGHSSHSWQKIAENK